MKTKEEIMHIIKNTISDVLALDYNEREKITPHTNLNSEFGMDSLDRTEATIFILKNTNIKLTIDQEDKLCDYMSHNPTIEAITNFLINSNQNAIQNNVKTIKPNFQKNMFSAQTLTTMQGVRQILSHQFDKPENEINMDTKLCNDLGASSLDNYELMCNIEDKFNIKLNSKTVSDILKQTNKEPTVAEIVKAIEDQKLKSQENLNRKNK